MVTGQIQFKALQSIGGRQTDGRTLQILNLNSKQAIWVKKEKKKKNIYIFSNMSFLIDRAYVAMAVPKTSLSPTQLSIKACNILYTVVFCSLHPPIDYHHHLVAVWDLELPHITTDTRQFIHIVTRVSKCLGLRSCDRAIFFGVCAKFWELYAQSKNLCILLFYLFS